MLDLRQIATKERSSKKQKTVPKGSEWECGWLTAQRIANASSNVESQIHLHLIQIARANVWVFVRYRTVQSRIYQTHHTTHIRCKCICSCVCAEGRK